MKKPLLSEALESRQLLGALSCTTVVTGSFTCALGAGFDIPPYDNTNPGSKSFFEVRGGNFTYVPASTVTPTFQVVNDAALLLATPDSDRTKVEYQSAIMTLEIKSGDQFATDPAYGALARCILNGQSGYEGGTSGTSCTVGGKYLGNWYGGVSFPLRTQKLTDDTTAIYYSNTAAAATIPTGSYLAVSGPLTIHQILDGDGTSCKFVNIVDFKPTSLTVTNPSGTVVLSNAAPQSNINLPANPIIDSGIEPIFNANAQFTTCDSKVQQQIFKAVKSQYP